MVFKCFSSFLSLSLFTESSSHAWSCQPSSGRSAIQNPSITGETTPCIRGAYSLHRVQSQSVLALFSHFSQFVTPCSPGGPNIICGSNFTSVVNNSSSSGACKPCNRASTQKRQMHVWRSFGSRARTPGVKGCRSLIFGIF